MAARLHTLEGVISCPHTLMGSKLTVTTQHLHYIVVGCSAKAPAQCTVGVRKTQTSCLTVLRKEKRKALKISIRHFINWKHNLTLDSGHPITKSGTEEKEEDREGREKLSWTWRESIKKEICNARGLFRLERLMHKTEELYERIKIKSPIPISSSHKPANNRAFHKATKVFKIFLHHILHSTALTSGTHCQRTEKPRA